jgi:hypothetical protein
MPRELSMFMGHGCTSWLPNFLFPSSKPLERESFSPSDVLGDDRQSLFRESPSFSEMMRTDRNFEVLKTLEYRLLTQKMSILIRKKDDEIEALHRQAKIKDEQISDLKDQLRKSDIIIQQCNKELILQSLDSEGTLDMDSRGISNLERKISQLESVMSEKMKFLHEEFQRTSISSTKRRRIMGISNQSIPVNLRKYNGTACNVVKPSAKDDSHVSYVSANSEASELSYNCVESDDEKDEMCENSEQENKKRNNGYHNNNSSDVHSDLSIEKELFV